MAYCAKLIDEVAGNGAYLMEPILGQGRWFTLSTKANWMDKSTIVNFLTQCIAAQILLAGQMPLTFRLIDEGLRSRVFHYVYDAEVIRGPREELDTVRKKAYTELLGSSYLALLQEHYQRKLRIEAEATIQEFV